MHKGLVGIAALVLSGMTVPAQAEIFDLSIGDNSFRGSFYGPLSRFVSDTNGQYDAGVIVRPKREDDLFVAHVGALVTGDAGARDFNLAAGVAADQREARHHRAHDAGPKAVAGEQDDVGQVGVSEQPFNHVRDILDRVIGQEVALQNLPVTLCLDRCDAPGRRVVSRRGQPAHHLAAVCARTAAVCAGFPHR